MATKGNPVADNLYWSLLGTDSAPLKDRAAALEFEALLHRGRAVYRQCPGKRLALHTALRDLVDAWESLLREGPTTTPRIRCARPGSATSGRRSTSGACRACWRGGCDAGQEGRARVHPMRRSRARLWSAATS